MRHWLFILVGVGSIALIILLVSQQFQLRSLSREVSSRTESLINEIRGNAESSTAVRNNVVILASEINEILNALRLPGSAVYFAAGEEANEESGEEVSMYLRGVDALVRAWDDERRGQVIHEAEYFLENRLPSSEYTITERDRITLDISLSAGSAFSVGLEEGSEEILVLSVDGNQRHFDEVGSELVDFLVSGTDDARAILEKSFSMDASLTDLFGGVDVQAYLKDNELSLSETRSGAGVMEIISYSIVRKGRLLLTVFPDPVEGVFVVGGRKVQRSDSVFVAAREQIEAMDVRSPEEIRIGELLIEMRGITADTGFSDFLESRGLSIVDDGREDSDYYYFDLYFGSEQRIGAFGVQKFVGELYLVDHEDVPISALYANSITDVKKN